MKDNKTGYLSQQPDMEVRCHVVVILSGSIIENTTTRISRPRVLPCWSVGYKIWNHIKLGFKRNSGNAVSEFACV